MNFWLSQFELRVRPILTHISLRQEHQLVAASGRNVLRRLTAATTGSKPDEGMAVRLLCLLCDFGTSKTTRPSPDLGCSTTEKKNMYDVFVEKVSNFEHVYEHDSLICRVMNHALTSTRVCIMKEYYLSAYSSIIHFPVFLEVINRNTCDNKGDII
jgi:hypothetical protein